MTSNKHNNIQPPPPPPPPPNPCAGRPPARTTTKMLTQRSVITKTKRGKILCFTNEHYLRNDIVCGVANCTTCHAVNKKNVHSVFPQKMPEYQLKDAGDVTLYQLLQDFDYDNILSKYVKDNEITNVAEDLKYQQMKEYFAEFKKLLYQQYTKYTTLSTQDAKFVQNPNMVLIPDTSVYLEQIDLLEQQIPMFGNLVVLQSILQYFQQKHFKLYQKVRAICTAATFQTSLLLKSNFSGTSTSIVNNDAATTTTLAPMIPKVHVFNDLHHQQVYKASTQQLSFNNCDLYLPKNVIAPGQQPPMNPSSSSSDDEEEDQDEYNILTQGFVQYEDEVALSPEEEAAKKQAEEETQAEERKTVEQQALFDFMLASTRWYQIHTAALNNTEATLPPEIHQQYAHQQLDEVDRSPFNLVLGLTNHFSTALDHVKRGVLTIPMEFYVAVYTQIYPSLPTLLLKAQDEHKKQASREKVAYKPHLSAVEMETGLQSGALFMGKLMLDRDFWSQGTVSCPQYGRVLIPGMKNMNRAFDGDLVAFKVLPRDQWLTMKAELAPNEAEEDKKNYSTDENGQQVATNAAGVPVPLSEVGFEAASDLADGILEKTTEDDAAFDTLNEKNNTTTKDDGMSDTANAHVVPTGEIVGIITEGNRVYCGSIEKTDKETGTVVFLPINRRIPKCLVDSKQIQSIMGSRLLVRYDSWSNASRYPSGHITRVLGNIGDNEAETQMVLIEHDIRHDPWSIEVEKCLPSADYVIDDQERAGRVDLRNVAICSIDPPGCTDIDDALHCVPLPNGNYEVGVHIADVTHYMKPGSALDQEAAKRSTSVYLVDRRIDMIPARLSTNLCSLHEHVERLAFSTIWELSPEAEIINVKFFKSVILSRGAMTYAQAQERIDLEPEHCTTPELKALYEDELTPPCKNLMMLAKKIKARRISEGALTLASSEVKFKMNQDRTQAEDLAVYQLKDANSLVEEFMLLANVSVAEHILRYFPLSALLRGHPCPPEEMLQPLVKAAKSWGYDVDITSGKALSDSLDLIVDANNPMFNKVMRMLTTRCMTQAKYVSSGEINSLKQLHHFGLAMNTYTHFTSPIRRYADVLVHRLLATSLGLCPLPEQIKDRAHMRDVVENLNFRHKQAQLASRASTDVWILKYFSQKQEEVVADALVLAVRSTGVRCVVQQFGIEIAIKLVPQQYAKQVETVNFKTPAENDANTPTTGYFYNPNLMTLTLNGSQFKILQGLKVKLCVKENKNRRRWLHVELEGESRHLLTTDIIQLLYDEVVEECRTAPAQSGDDATQNVVDKPVEGVDAEDYKPMPSFIDEEELQEIEAKAETNNKTKGKKATTAKGKKAAAAKEKTTTTTTTKQQEDDIEHVNKKRKTNEMGRK